MLGILGILIKSSIQSLVIKENSKGNIFRVFVSANKYYFISHQHLPHYLGSMQSVSFLPFFSETDHCQDYDILHDARSQYGRFLSMMSMVYIMGKFVKHNYKILTATN